MQLDTITSSAMSRNEYVPAELLDQFNHMNALILKIFDYLSDPELGKCALVSKRWKKIADRVSGDPHKKFNAEYLYNPYCILQHTSEYALWNTRYKKSVIGLFESCVYLNGQDKIIAIGEESIKIDVLLITDPDPEKLPLETMEPQNTSGTFKITFRHPRTRGEFHNRAHLEFTPKLYGEEKTASLYGEEKTASEVSFGKTKMWVKTLKIVQRLLDEVPFPQKFQSQYNGDTREFTEWLAERAPKQLESKDLGFHNSQHLVLIQEKNIDNGSI